MFRAGDYVRVDGLAEAHKLRQKRSNLVVGGMVWLKITNATKRTIVDLSGLGLDQIEGTGEEFRIGYMSTLCQIETHQGLNQYFGDIFRECTRHIVEVQMRNYATVGGSTYSRLGFSDILTCMMALDAHVEFYHGGIMPLSEFTKRPVCRDDKDILVRVTIKKDGRKTTYTTQRNSSMDLPLLACCVSHRDSNRYAVVGARPSKAQVVAVTDDGYDSLAQLAHEAADSFIYGINTRGSNRCRRQLASAYIRHLMERLTGRSVTTG